MVIVWASFMVEESVFEQKNGSSKFVEICRSKKNWTLDIKVSRRELKIKTKALD